MGGWEDQKTKIGKIPLGSLRSTNFFCPRRSFFSFSQSGAWSQATKKRDARAEMLFYSLRLSRLFWRCRCHRSLVRPRIPALAPECRSDDIVFNVGRKKQRSRFVYLCWMHRHLLNKIKFFRCVSWNFNKINIRFYTHNWGKYFKSLFVVMATYSFPVSNTKEQEHCLL